MHRSEVIDIQESEKFYVLVYEGLGHPKPLNPHLIFGGLEFRAWKSTTFPGSFPAGRVLEFSKLGSPLGPLL